MDRHQHQEKQQRHEEAVTGVGERRGTAMLSSRRGRFDHPDGLLATAPVVDQADCTARSCRSCVAVTLADAIALGCCPCAVVSLLGLAFVKAPLAVARRCLRRLRRRRGEMRHKKRVRDDDVDPAAKCRHRRRGGAHDDADKWKGGEAASAEKGAAAAAAGRRSSSCASSGRLDAEKVWMEMYRVGQWGFGRLSVSVTPPRPSARAARCSDGDGGATRGRKDAALRCES
ncbi:hypothetical protein PR202_ga10238 [Eleusine coracana subsp. coracana]|uniref:Uncharacterized protein n=1 Tax=Eleusine coracana subsp. coracana TaxID=191504 RepID=A0AAV5C663_ELECO|nr:hypothetical protein PR202_ga10238 [Eleusine coracana subsp. coracana]